MGRSMNVFFDVLDTLIDENGNPRPYARKVLLDLTGMGHDVYLWSSGGIGSGGLSAGEEVRRW